MTPLSSEPPSNKGDDYGTGTCQHLSLTDQLNMGIRHVEIDINWTPEEGIKTCHSPIPLDPQTIYQVEEAARQRNLTLDWDIEKLSCLKTSRPFKSSLQEVKVRLRGCWRTLSSLNSFARLCFAMCACRPLDLGPPAPFSGLFGPQPRGGGDCLP